MAVSQIVLALCVLLGSASAAAPNSDWTMVYDLDIPEDTNTAQSKGKGWDKRNMIPYTTDTCEAFDDSGVEFYKVAYVKQG